MVNIYLRTGAHGQTNSSVFVVVFTIVEVYNNLIMKILGVGVDLIQNGRMNQLINKVNFLNKVLHPGEITTFNQIQT